MELGRAQEKVSATLESRGKIRAKLGLLFVALSVFQLLTALGSLAVAFRLYQSYSETVLQRRTSNERRHVLSELQRFADAATPPVPGKRFDAESLRQDLRRMEYASSLFLQRGRRLLKSLSAPGDSDLRQQAYLVMRGMEEALVQTKRALSAGQAGQRRFYDSALVYADRSASRVQTTLGNMVEDISRVETATIDAQRAWALKISRFLALLLAVTCLLVVPAALYAYGLNRQISAYERELAAERNALERRVQERTAELRRSEEQFRQAQKLEAVGRLASGVAHDFNNLLTVISSYTEILQESLSGKQHDLSQEILKATEKASAVTRQLLAFSRSQVLSPEAINLNLVVQETTKMASRLIGEDIELVFTPAESLGMVMADRNQIGQALLNLCVNARDAMPDGGRLTVRTYNSSIAVAADAAAGDYAVLEVSDTGTGMTEEVQAKIFEPFFTTKELGKGTGLGLSMVYGIVKQSGGTIRVHSEVGKGSTFKLFFPLTSQSEEISPPESTTSVDGQGKTILLVEDERALRESTATCLALQGYNVLSAGSGKEALGLARRHSGTIDLLLTDVVMPGISGPELATELAKQRPELASLYVSGHTDHALLGRVNDSELRLLRKPFRLRTLTERVSRSIAEHSTGITPEKKPPQRDEDQLAKNIRRGGTGKMRLIGARGLA